MSQNIGKLDTPKKNLEIIGNLQEIIGDSEVGIIEDVPKFHCKTSDVSDAVFDDTLVVNSTTYKIKKIEPDGTGMTVLHLST